MIADGVVRGYLMGKGISAAGFNRIRDWDDLCVGVGINDTYAAFILHYLLVLYKKVITYSFRARSISVL